MPSREHTKENLMSTPSAARRIAPPSGSGDPASSGMAVIAWLVLTSAIVPLAMGAHGDGRGYMWAGLAMVASGVALLIASRLTRNRR